MRFPGLKSRKSTSSRLDASGEDDASNTGQPSIVRSGSASALSTLSRWKSSQSTSGDPAVAGRAVPEQQDSAATTTHSGKRSLFRKRSHARSQSTAALGSESQPPPLPRASHDGLLVTEQAVPEHSRHPLRQQTLPADLMPPDKTVKRPALSFSKRGFTLDYSGRQKHEGLGIKEPSMRSSFSSDRPTGSSPDVTPSHSGLLSSTSRPSDSFLVKSFRSVNGVREEPTLSSLVSEEITHSPLSTRPSSPVTAPAVASSSTSYFDNRGLTSPPHSPSIGQREKPASGSITVSKFREARAARSTTSLNSTASHGPVLAPPGLNLDLPPPISINYSPRPSLSISQPDLSSARMNSPTLGSPDWTRSASPSREHSFSQWGQAQGALSSPSRTSSDDGSLWHSTSRGGPVSHPLAIHPDNALPLPPVPVDPEQDRRHSRRVSTQSVASMSSALGGWLNAASSNLSAAFLAEEEEKAVTSSPRAGPKNPPASASQRLPSVSASAPSAGNATTAGHGQPKEIQPPRSVTPLTAEELSQLLGGKVLPPPPSETDDEPAKSHTWVSPKAALSRASSVANLSFAKNLFSSGNFKAAKPADDDDSDSDEDAEVLGKDTHSHAHLSQKNERDAASTDIVRQSTSSDSLSSDGDSDDSETKAKKRKKALLYPPPRPRDAKDRDRSYAAAVTPNSLSPQNSYSDLRKFSPSPVQPMPRIGALTSQNLSALDPDGSDEENVPLFKIRERARSEVGAIAPGKIHPNAMTNLRSDRPHYSSFVPMPKGAGRAASSLGFSSRGSQSLKSAPLPPDSLASSSMPRSLSNFSMTSSDSTFNRNASQSRSASSDSVRTLANNGHSRSHEPTLSSLIAQELAGGHDDERPAARRASQPPVPAVPSSYLRAACTPARAERLDPSPASRSQNRLSSTNSSISDWGILAPERQTASSKSDIGVHAATSETGNVTDQIKQRHRADVRRSGLVSLGGEIPHAGPSATEASAPSQMNMHSPPPPGVDPALYASLPADQKLALQMRSQQLLAMMQSFALQAHNGGLPPIGPAMPFMAPMPMPPQLQMPMIGVNAGGLAPFPTPLSGAPLFPAMQPWQVNPAASHIMPPRTGAFSSIGLPTALQQTRRDVEQSRPRKFSDHTPH